MRGWRLIGSAHQFGGKPLKVVVVAVFVTLSVVGAAVLAAARPAPPPAAEPPLSPEVRKTAEALRERAFSGTKAADWVRGLTDEVGPRLSGSPQDAVGVAWALAKLKELGFSNVHAEKVMVPAWQRGIETGGVTAPFRQKLVLAALGGSPATPEGGLEAGVVGGGSLGELEAKGSARWGCSSGRSGQTTPGCRTRGRWTMSMGSRRSRRRRSRFPTPRCSSGSSRRGSPSGAVSRRPAGGGRRGGGGR